MTSHTNQQPLQAIRSRSANEVIKVATRHDALTGNQIVLWSDIQNVFKDAVSIRKGDVLVSFVTDSNFTPIVPLRIPYYPNDVLEVITESSGGGGGGSSIGGSIGHHATTVYTPSPTLTNSFTLPNPQSSPELASISIHNQQPLVGQWAPQQQQGTMMYQDPQWIAVHNQSPPLSPTVPMVVTSTSTALPYKISSAAAVQQQQQQQKEQQLQVQSDHIIQFQQQMLKEVPIIQNYIQARIWRLPVTMIVALVVIMLVVMVFVAAIPFIILDYIFSPRWLVYFCAKNAGKIDEM
ncbi:MAG: hypothetical protein J3Q66DRAFT_391304 [Benniella sp.]|nr:MAG: hypothetical protein J3Q66DRAFT_391304 [Benniella sp.]